MKKFARFFIAAFLALNSLQCGESNSYPAGIRALQKEVKAEPENWPKHLELAERYLADKFYPEAIQELRGVAEHSPNDFEVGWKLVFAQYDNKDMDGALKTAEEMTQKKPDEALGYLALGFLHFYRQDYQKCYDNLSTANKLGNWPEKFTLYLLYRMGYSLSKLNKPDEANLFFQKVLEKDPAHIETLWFQANEAFRAQKWNDAERMFKLMISKKPDEALFYLELGLLYYHQSLWEKSTTYLRKATDLDTRARGFAVLAEAAKLYDIPEKWDLAMCYFNNVETGEKYQQYREKGKYVVSGEIINVGVRIARDVHLTVQYYNKKNEVIDDEDHFLKPRSLMPMQSREFKVEIPDNPDIEIAKVSFNWHN